MMKLLLCENSKTVVPEFKVKIIHKDKMLVIYVTNNYMYERYAICDQYDLIESN